MFFAIDISLFFLKMDGSFVKALKSSDFKKQKKERRRIEDEESKSTEIGIYINGRFFPSDVFLYRHIWGRKV